MSSQPSGSKRKTDDGAPAPAAKKTRGGAAHAATVALVNSILANPKGYPISGNEEVVRKSLVELAKYARELEEQIAGAPVAGSSKAVVAVAAKPARSQAELEAAADKIRRAAQSGIKKQMTVRPPSGCAYTGLPALRRATADPCCCAVEAVVQDGLRQVLLRRHLP